MRRDQARTLSEIFEDEGIGSAVAQIRLNCAHESQMDFAIRFGMSRAQLAKIETGKIAATAAFVLAVCNSFDVHPEWIALHGGPDTAPGKFSEMSEKSSVIIQRICAENRDLKFRHLWKLMLVVTSTNNRQFTIDNKNHYDIIVPVKRKVPTWHELKREIIRLTSKRGEKSALARELKISRQVLGNWLSEDNLAVPNAEQTLELLNRFWKF